MCLVEGKEQSPVSCPSQSSPGKKTQSLSARLGESVQDLARAVDSEARVTHVSSQGDGSFLVRVRGGRDHADGIRTVLRGYYPLASVAIVENVLEGSISAEVLFPSQEDERALALQIARESGASRFLSSAALCSAGVAFLSFAFILFVNTDANLCGAD